MKGTSNVETEIKLAIPSTEGWDVRLEAAGFELRVPVQSERSVLWDRASQLAEADCALRLRRHGGRAVLTWKGPRMPDPRLKIRLERETAVEDPEAMEAILAALGYEPTLRMEKLRGVWERPGLTACLDRTPFGSYLELEGEPPVIQEAIDQLGLEAAQVEPRTYVTLFLEHDSGVGPGPPVRRVPGVAGTLPE